MSWDGMSPPALAMDSISTGHSDIGVLTHSLFCGQCLWGVPRTGGGLGHVAGAALRGSGLEWALELCRRALCCLTLSLPPPHANAALGLLVGTALHCGAGCSRIPASSLCLSKSREGTRVSC